MAPRIVCLPTLLLVAAACGDATAPDDFVDAALATTVAAGETHTCALTHDGSAFCWGGNGSGQLGDGTTEGRLRPVAVETGHRFASVHAAASPGGWNGYSCGLTEEGEAWCWGSNFYGELGDGTTTGHAAPRRAGGSLRFRSLSLSLGVSCGIAEDGRAWCWGSNHYGQLGDGTRDDRAMPVAVSTTSRFRAVGVGQEVCGLTEGGEVLCWGAHRGVDGEISARLEPTRLETRLRIGWLAVGSGHACALTEDGEAWCWGSNVHGALGDGTSDWRGVPVKVSTSLRFTRLVTGAGHTCGLTDRGEAHCWGYNASGSLGDGTTAIRRAPVPVVGGHAFRSLSAGAYHTCGVTVEGSLYCWGRNDWGQLGDGSGSLAWSRPVPVRW